MMNCVWMLSVVDSHSGVGIGVKGIYDSFRKAFEAYRELAFEQEISQQIDVERGVYIYTTILRKWRIERMTINATRH